MLRSIARFPKNFSRRYRLARVIEGFDARKKKDAQLYLNYKPFKKGKIKLLVPTSGERTKIT